MNDSNVTPDENAPEELVAPDETPVVVEKVHTVDTVVEPVAEPVAEPLVEPVVEPLVEPVVEPVVASDVTMADDHLAHANIAETPGAESHAAEAHVAETHVAETSVEDAPVVPAAATSEVVAAPVQTVYVTAPTPPRAKGNRGMGALLAFLATIVFALVYVAVAAVLILFASRDGVVSAIGTFVANPLFYVPVLVFFVMMILWALLANRASWWSWVIGSLVIAVVTYFASIGVLLLLSGGFSLTAREGATVFAELAVNPLVIAAALVARESAIWFGAAIAKRGRKVRERNYAAWQAFENEEAQKRAEFGGVAAS